MALYVSAQNQKLLWEVLHKNELVHRVFSGQSNQRQKEEWFKSVVQLFYEQNKYRNITKHDLNEVNRETLIYMTNKMREHLTPKQAPLTNTNNISTPPIIPDNREDFFNKQFTARQKEYEQMNEKKVPETIDFGDKLEDQPISNMEDLIKQHMQMRENELKQYSPLPPSVPQSVSQLKIDSKTNITLDAVVIDESVKPKKEVRWQSDNGQSEYMSRQSDNGQSDNGQSEYMSGQSDNGQSEYITSQKEIELIRKTIIEMSSKMEIMMLEIENLKKT
jgi:nitrate reductase cytochrome c-type subunit